MKTTSVDVTALIDKGPLGLYRIVIVATCCAVAMIDGFDTQSIAFVAPEIAAAWRVPAAQFGPVFAVGLFGGLLGAVIFGAVGDRYGRKIVLLPAMALFAVASLATVAAQTIPSLLAFRLLTGLGLGGAIPSVIAITSEYSPGSRRATIVTVMFCGFPLGAVVGGAMSAKLIPAYGWHAVFYAGGALPLILLPLVWLWVPESIRFLVHRRADPAAIGRILRRIQPQAILPDRAAFTAAEDRTEGSSVRQLFADGRGAGTVLLWATFFMSLMLSFFLVNWLPILFRQLGFPIASAVMATVMLNAGGILGSVVLARLIDRFGPYAIIAPGYAIGTVFVALIGLVDAPLGIMLAIVFCAGFFSIGAQLGAVSLAATFYPTAVRATGIGGCMGVGRIGAIAGPLTGGVLIGTGLGIGVIFLAAALASLVASAAIVAMRRFGPPYTVSAMNSRIIA
jgi:AAHS family 4-hydroxybenzoate transporter-like MFS transporter